MQGWHYGKGLIYYRPIFRLTKLAFLRARANKLIHFTATHLLVMSSRLFAAALVTASYNTGLWVFFIFAFHYISIVVCDLVWLHGIDREGGIYLT